MAERKQQTDYADPTQALSHYLDDLLHSATREETASPEITSETSLRTEPVAAPQPEKPVEATAASSASLVSQAPVVPRVSKEERENRRQRAREKAERVRAKRVATDPVVASQQTAAPENLTPEGRPVWAESAFECLLFRVAGLQLAVPLVLLGAIHRIEADIRELPGSPDWFMGILSTSHGNLRVVNTAKWVMPGRAPTSGEAGYQFVIRLNNSEWGLACDDVAQSFSLDPDAVKWRSERSRRPWLAGTVIDHMCALVDVRTMASLLSRAQKEQHLDITG